jgi:hypothetical protein
MRRLLATAAFAAALLTAAACGSDPESDSDAGSDPSPSVDVSANSAEVCTATKKLITDSTKEFSESLATLITAKPDDKAAQEQSLASVKGLFTQWSEGLREQAGKAADPELKAGLTESADGLATATEQIKTFDDLEHADTALDNAKMEAAGKKIEKVCGPMS